MDCNQSNDANDAKSKKIYFDEDDDCLFKNSFDSSKFSKDNKASLKPQGLGVNKPPSNDKDNNEKNENKNSHQVGLRFHNVEKNVERQENFKVNEELDVDKNSNKFKANMPDKSKEALVSRLSIASDGCGHLSEENNNYNKNSSNDNNKNNTNTNNGNPKNENKKKNVLKETNLNQDKNQLLNSKQIEQRILNFPKYGEDLVPLANNKRISQDSIYLEKDCKGKRRSHSSSIKSFKFPTKEDLSDPLDFSIYQNIIDFIGISPYNLKIYLIVSLYFLVDGGELMVLSLILSKLSKDWELSSHQKGVLGSSVYVGIYIGAVVSGKFSDTKGRKPIFILGSLIITLFAFFSAFVNGYYSFLFCRGLCGLGIGLTLPSAFALATEVTPTKHRHFILNMIWIFHPFGEIFSVCLAKIFIGYNWGWRYILGFASLPCFIALVMAFSIEESPKFLLTIGKQDEGIKGVQEIINKSGIQFQLTKKLVEKLKEEFKIENKNLEKNNKNIFKSEQKNRPDDSKNRNELNIPQNELGYKKNFELKNFDENELGNRQQINKKNNNNNNRNIDEGNNYKYKIKDKNFNTPLIDKEEEEETNSGLRSNNSIATNNDSDEPVVNFSDLLNKENRNLTVLIWLIFIFSALVYEGLVYILPQILEEMEELEHVNSNTITDNPGGDNSYLRLLSFLSPRRKLRNLHGGDISGELDFTGELSNSNFINLVISALMEIPSLIFSTYMASYGRINAMAFGFLLSTFFSFVCFLSDSWFSFSIAMVKLFICVPETVIMIYACEAYPTKIRSLGVGVSNSFHRIGSMLTPFLCQHLFEAFHKNPFILFTFGSLLGLISTVLLPFETSNIDIK